MLSFTFSTGVVVGAVVGAVVCVGVPAAFAFVAKQLGWVKSKV